MKLLTLAPIILFCATSVYGDALTPDRSVEQTVRHAHEGAVVGADLQSLSKTSRHAWTKESFLQVLNEIAPDKIVFQASDQQKGFFSFPLPDGKALVHMLEPKHLDFELTFVEDKSNRYGGSYVITALHP